MGFFVEFQTLCHTEALLFINDNEGEVGKVRLFLKQGMRSKNEAFFVMQQMQLFFLSCFCGVTAVQHMGGDAERRCHAGGNACRLCCQQGGGCHQCRLIARQCHLEHCQQCHDGFATAHISLQQPQHPFVTDEVGCDGTKGGFLTIG